MIQPLKAAWYLSRYLCSTVYDADVQAAVKKITEELGDTGRILVRESGTEPVVRVMVEAESEEICQKYVDMVVGVIEEKGYVAG